MTHTPGPWTYNFNPGLYGQVIEAATGKLIADPAEFRDWRAHSGSSAEAVANARLIAAAPDLLAALIAIADAGDGVRMEPEYWAAVMDAINKAKGAP